VRPLPLFLLFFFLAAPWARAQTRSAAVEALPNSAPQSGSMTSGLGGAPALISLNLAAPSLSPGTSLIPLALAPTPALTAAPYAAAVPAPLALVPAAVPVLPVSYISPARPMELKADARPAGGKAALAEAPPDLAAAPMSDLIDYTKRVFGESTKPGFESADYLRPGQPFLFGAAEASAYRAALDAPFAKSGASELSALVASAAALAKSAGIKAAIGERAGHDGVMRPVLSIVPERDGHRLNRLAWDMARSFDSAVEYAPHRTNGGVAAYNSAEKVLFLPDFGRDEAFEAILHESRHASFAKRLRRGDLSVFHAALLAYAGRSIAPNAETYTGYMSLEEISAHAKTLLHAILRAQRGGGARAAADARKYAYQLMDVLRSSEINLFQLQRMLAKGEVKTYLVTGDSWPAIPGGHWEAVNLPHAIFVLPVLDEAPAPKRDLWDRVFKDAPETAAVKAARRHAEALRPLVAALSLELAPFLDALRKDEPDLGAARASAVRMVSLADKADKAFAAAR
jgi:hypothetical protein